MPETVAQLPKNPAGGVAEIPESGPDGALFSRRGWRIDPVLPGE